MDGGTVTKCNFAGDEKAGASWTDMIMANKADAVSTQKPKGEGEGAEEDEWVRTPTKSNPSIYTEGGVGASWLACQLYLCNPI